MSSDKKNPPDFLDGEEAAKRHPYREPQEPTKTVSRLRQFFVDRTRHWPLILGALSIAGAFIMAAPTSSLRLNGVILADGTNPPSGYVNLRAPEYNTSGTCKFDGTTDDTSCLNAAITATPTGGTLFIAKGKIKVTTTITINKQINVIGAGPQSEIWCALSDPTKQCVVFGQPYPTGTTSAQGMTIRDFSVQGAAGSCFNGIAFYQIYRSHVSNLYVMPGSTAQAIVVGGAIASEFHHIVISKNTTGLYDAAAGAWFGAAVMVADLRNGTPVQSFPGGAVMPTNACIFSGLVLEGGTTTGGVTVEAQDQGGGNNRFIGGTYEGFQNAGASAVKGSGYTLRIEGGQGFRLDGLDLESSLSGVFINGASNFSIGEMVIPNTETVSIAGNTNYTIAPGVWVGVAKEQTVTGAMTQTGNYALTGNLTQSGGVLSCTGNAASQISTSAGALTITGAAASTWDSHDGTVKAASYDTTASTTLTWKVAGTSGWTLASVNNVLNTAQGDGSGSIGTTGTRIAGVHALRYDGAMQNVVAATSLTLNPGIGETIQISLSATAITSITMTAGNTSQILTVEVIQDATGGRTIPTTWTNVLFAGGTYTATATASKRDVLTFRYDSLSSKWVEMSRAMSL